MTTLELVPLYLKYVDELGSNREFIPSLVDGIPDVNEEWPGGLTLPSLTRDLWSGPNPMAFYPYHIRSSDNPFDASNWFFEYPNWIYGGAAYAIPRLSLDGDGYASLVNRIWYDNYSSFDGTTPGPWAGSIYLLGYAESEGGSGSGIVGAELGPVALNNTSHISYDGTNFRTVEYITNDNKIYCVGNFDINSFKDIDDKFLWLSRDLTGDFDSECWIAVKGTGVAKLTICVGICVSLSSDTFTNTLKNVNSYLAVGGSESCFDEIDPTTFSVSSDPVGYLDQAYDSQENDSGDNGPVPVYQFTVNVFIDPARTQNGWGIFRIKPIKTGSGGSEVNADYHIEQIILDIENNPSWVGPFVQQRNLQGNFVVSDIKFE